MNKDELKHVVIDQKLEYKVFNKRNFPRNKTKQLQELINDSQLIKVVLGIRRCGKSKISAMALAKHNTAYINFDDERLIGIDTKELQIIFDILKEIYPNANMFFFDEIQNINGWELFLNRLSRNNINIVVSGSNGKLLGKDLATHLTGRSLTLTLYPLSFNEFVAWREVGNVENKPLSKANKSKLQKIQSLFEEYFKIGGFPQVLLGEPAGLFLRELFDKIISRDIVQRYKIRESKILKEIGLYLLQNSGQFISFQNVKKTFNLNSLVTTRRYIEFLNDVFLIHELRAYSYKLKERSTAKRKIYACDVGMMNAVWNKPTKDLGSKFETAVFLQLLSAEQEVYYLNESDIEVDFCCLLNGNPDMLIQACYQLNENDSTKNTLNRELRGLVVLGKKYGVDKLFIVTPGYEEERIVDQLKIKIIPFYKFCQNLLKL